MKQQYLVVLALTLLGCNSKDVAEVQLRADGVEVGCEPMEGEDDVQICTPSEECSPGATAESPYLLWPPNHKYHEVTAEQCLEVANACSEADPVESTGPWTIVAITSDEAIEVGQGGDGNTQADMKIEENVASLRAERQGGGDGRVYILHLEDADGQTVSCRIDVPHDQSGAGAVDSGEATRIPE